MAQQYLNEQYLYQKICGNLALYYESKKVRDAYFNDANVGKFTEFCEENGTTEDDVVREELNLDDPHESLFADLDDNFPGLEANLSKEDRAAQILEILRRCSRNGHVTVKPLKVSASQYRITEKDMQTMKILYKSQCPVIYNQAHFEEDESLLKMLSLSHKLNENYIGHLVDMYNRERLENHYFRMHETPAFTAFSFAERCQHLRELDKVSSMKYRLGDKGKPSDDAGAGIQSFLHRISPELQLNAPNAICDSLSTVCHYIEAIAVFVSKLANADIGFNQSKGINSTYAACAFQCDFTFAFNKCIKKNQGLPLQYEDDDDDDDNEDSDEHKFEFYDVFGAVKEKLSANKLSFHADAISAEALQSPPNIWMALLREFNGSFQKFKEQMKKKYAKVRGKDVMEEYPRKHRFCALIDRRKPDNGDNKDKGILEEDELIIYEPPSDCDEFPKKPHVPLFYFETSRKCIIPNLTYPKGPDIRHSKNRDNKDLVMKQIITSQSICNAALLTLSFHVESMDEIRCYLFINGQTIRFMPSDIRELLPLFFDEDFGKNKEWRDTGVAYKMTDRIAGRLTDAKFEAFLEAYKAQVADELKSIPIKSKFVIEVPTG